MTGAKSPCARAQQADEPVQGAGKAFSALEARLVDKALDTLEAMAAMVDSMESDCASGEWVEQEKFDILSELAEEMAVNLGFFGYEPVLASTTAIMGAGRNGCSDLQASVTVVRHALTDIEKELSRKSGMERSTQLIARI